MKGVLGKEFILCHNSYAAFHEQADKDFPERLHQARKIIYIKPTKGGGIEVVKIVEKKPLREDDE